MNTGKRILIVEDSKTQAEVIRHILTAAGYQADIVSNGKEALSAVRNQRPDLILTDIIMPEMDGYEFCSIIKADPSLSQIPVLLVTRLYDPDDIIRGLSSGANSFIIKPIVEEDLLINISSFLYSQQKDRPGEPVQIYYRGAQYSITSDRLDILHILLSVYESAVKKNIELQVTTEKLRNLSEDLEEEVKKRTYEIEEKNRTVEELFLQRNQLFVQIGHDLKTPLTPLYALLPMVYQKEQDPELKEILQILVNDVQIIKRMTEKVFILSELTNESLSTKVVNIHICKMVDTVIHNNAYVIYQKNLDIKNRINPSITIHISPFHALTLVENLLSNAIKYNTTNGSVVITAEEDEEMVILTITDTGIGLSEEDQELVFHEFFKADRSRHDKDSHGLGLALVRRIVNLYGGSIHVESRGEGLGTSFILSLPKGRTLS